MGDFVNLSKYKMEKKEAIKDLQDNKVMENINTNNIILLSPDPYFYKKYYYNNTYIDIYKNLPIQRLRNKEYIRLYMESADGYYVKRNMLENIEDIYKFNRDITAYINNLDIVGSYSINNYEVDVYKMPNNWEDFKNRLNYCPSFNGKYLYYTKCCSMAKIEPQLEKLGLEVF